MTICNISSIISIKNTNRSANDKVAWLQLYLAVLWEVPEEQLLDNEEVDDVDVDDVVDDVAMAVCANKAAEMNEELLVLVLVLALAVEVEERS